MSLEISNSSRISDWNSLPSDLWVEIFSRLDVSTVLRMASICKKFREMVNNSKLLWQKLSLRNFNSIHITKESLIKDARFFHDFKKVNVKMKCVQTLEVRNSIVSAICFHKGNLITGSKGKTVRYWKNEWNSWKRIDRVKFKSSVESLFCVDNKLFVGCADGTAVFLDLSGYTSNKIGEILKHQETFFPFVKGEDQPEAMAVHTIFFGDGHLFCASVRRMKIYENKGNHWEKPFKFNYPGDLTTFSYKEGTLYCGGNDGEISIYKKGATNQWVDSFSFEAHDDFIVTKISWDGDELITMGEDGNVKYWSLWKCTRTLSLENALPTDVVSFKDISFLTVSQSSFIHIYKREENTFTFFHYIEANDGLMKGLSYSFGQLFSWTNQGVVKVWEVDNAPNQPQKKLKTHS